MCTVSVNINENQLRSIDPMLTDHDSITRWVQRLVDVRIADLVEIRSRENLKPYTIEELHERIKASEADFAAGRVYDFDEVIREIEEELDKEEVLDMAEAV